MSGKSKQHHLVEFAVRNTRPHFPTFNAHSAIWRLEELIDDAKQLQVLRESAENNAERFGNRLSTFEIVNYYVVGYITCLEWHARSRLADLLNYEPSNIEPTDVRAIDKTALSQMAAAKVTLPYIVAAGTNVSSIQDYAAIFARIFNALSLTQVNIDKLLREIPVSEAPTRSTERSLSSYEALAELFGTRHALVHEIGATVLAHFSLRDIWSPEDAIRIGEVALTAVRAVEAEITKHAPSAFPNRLDESGYPEDEQQKLNEAIRGLEDEISTTLGSDDDWEDVKLWKEALRTQRGAMIAEIKFLDDAEILRPVRHIDFTRSIKIRFLHSRLEYLRGLLDQLSQT